MNHSISESKMNRTGLERDKEASVQILFKGLKRKVSQRSYSKLKNNYKKASQNKELTAPLGNSLTNNKKLKLSIVPNRITDPQQAHEQLLKLKEANHKLSQQKTELLRKIRKQQKIQHIYRNKLQGRDLAALDYFRLLEIKLLLEVQALQSQLQHKQKLLQLKLSNVRSEKHALQDDLMERRVSMYGMMTAREDLKKMQREKNSTLALKEHTLCQLTLKQSNMKLNRVQKNQKLNQIKKQIDSLKYKFKAVQAQTKRDKNEQMASISTLMSSLTTNTQKVSTKQNHTLINNMSSISVKNKNNIEQLLIQIQKIKEESQTLNSQIQQFMDGKIKEKILIHKQINEMRQMQREAQNKILTSSKVDKSQQLRVTSRRDRTDVSPKCSIARS